MSRFTRLPKSRDEKERMRRVGYWRWGDILYADGEEGRTIGYDFQYPDDSGWAYCSLEGVVLLSTRESESIKFARTIHTTVREKHPDRFEPSKWTDTEEDYCVALESLRKAKFRSDFSGLKSRVPNPQEELRRSGVCDAPKSVTDEDIEDDWVDIRFRDEVPNKRSQTGWTELSVTRTILDAPEQDKKAEKGLAYLYDRVVRTYRDHSWTAWIRVSEREEDRLWTEFKTRLRTAITTFVDLAHEANAPTGAPEEHPAEYSDFDFIIDLRGRDYTGDCPSLPFIFPSDSKDASQAQGSSRTAILKIPLLEIKSERDALARKAADMFTCEVKKDCPTVWESTCKAGMTNEEWTVSVYQSVVSSASTAMESDADIITWDEDHES